MNDPYGSNFDPLTQHVVNLKEAGQLRESAARLVRESAAMFEEANARSAGRPYSITRVVTALATGGRIDGVERETAQELSHRMGTGFDAQKPMVPWGALSQRAMLTSDANSGANIVGTSMYPALDLLRPVSVVARLGATVIEGLTGDISVPKITTSASPAWVAETGTATASEPTFAQVTASPKRVVTYTPLSKQLLAQAPMIADRVLGQHLRGVLGLELDRAVLAGTGTNSPTGILHTPGVTVTSAASYDFADAHAQLKAVASADVDDARISFLSTPAARETLSQRSVGTGGETYVWSMLNTIASKPAHVSSTVPAATIYAGSFEHCWLLMWGQGIAIEVNPYAAFKSDIVGVKAVAFADVVVAYPAAFAVGTGLS